MKPVSTSSCAECPIQTRCVFKHETNRSLKNMTSYRKGSSLFQQGSPVHGIHCVSSGKVKVGSLTPDGKESIISIASAGDVLGHRYIFHSGFYTHTAVALEKTSVCFIELEHVKEMMKHNFSFNQEIIARLSQEIEISDNFGHAIMLKGARSRVADLLLSMAKEFGAQEFDKVKINLPLTRSELASMIGIAHETMIRLLTELSESRVIEKVGKHMFIVDLPKLQSLAK